MLLFQIVSRPLTPLDGRLTFFTLPVETRSGTDRIDREANDERFQPGESICTRSCSRTATNDHSYSPFDHSNFRRVSGLSSLLKSHFTVRLGHGRSPAIVYGQGRNVERGRRRQLGRGFILDWK